MPEKPTEKTPPLVEVHTRLFEDDIALVKKIAAEKGLAWQIELRLTVRRALREARILER